MQPHLLVLENFQSLRERTEIPIGPLTFLYGPNSAGKSCIDDALILLSTVFVGPLRSDVSHWKMFERWFHFHQTKDGIGFEKPAKACLELHCKVGRIFEGTSEVSSFGEFVDSSSGLVGWLSKTDWNIVLGLEWDSDGAMTLSLSAGSECIFRTVSTEDGVLLQISRKAFGSTFKALADKHFVDAETRIETYEFQCELVMNPTPVLSIYKGDDFNRDLVSIVNAMLQDLQQLQIAPINLGADRSTINNSALSKICGTSYLALSEHVLHHDGLPTSFYDAPKLDVRVARISDADFMDKLAESSYASAYGEINKPPLTRNPELIVAIDTLVTWNFDTKAQNSEELHVFVNRCLREHLFLDQGYQLIFEALEIKPATDVDVPPLSAALMIGSLVDKTGRRMTFEDVGTGISCVIPVLVAVHSGNGFIQQPELHLHPALQSALGDVFVEAVKTQHAYHFVETHSEYILLRCLRRIRETTAGKHPAGSPLALMPEDLSVLYFEPQSDGCTKVKRIRISTQGDFVDRWPRGFFEERGRELFDE